jgi:hypothetical protein
VHRRLAARPSRPADAVWCATESGS